MQQPVTAAAGAADSQPVGTIWKVAGPLIVATGMAGVQMYDVVRVSEKRLIGEVIELRETAPPSRSMRRPRDSAPASRCI